MRAMVVTAALLFACACGSSVQSPSIPTAPTGAATASFTPSPTPGPTGSAASPTIDCADPADFDPPPELTCSAAVTAAREVLPAGAGTITTISFSYGAWCPPGRECGPVQPFGGYVVFRFADGTATFVTVSPGKRGTLLSPGRPGPFPPTLAHYAAWDGWGFGYPLAWRFSPGHWLFSFQSTIGYIGTIPVDPARICQSSPSSLSCDFRAYDLPPGNVVVFLSRAGNGMTDPVAFYDHPGRGSRVNVGGSPAVFIDQKTVATDRRLLTWRIARPDAYGNWIELDAEIHGPDDGTLRAQLDALIASFQFVPPAIPLTTDPTMADAIAKKAIATITTAQPDAYTCFPDRTGPTMKATIRRLPDMVLNKSLPVACSVKLKATDVGLWKLEFVVSWAKARDRKAGRLLIIHWLLADGTPQSMTGGGDQIPYCCQPIAAGRIP
jgi:hypothetical protein